MYCPPRYPQQTSNASAPYYVVQVPATGDTTVPSAKFHITADNAVSYPIIIRETITVVLDPPEFDDKQRIKPVRKPHYKPPVREIVAPWKAKWRLTQQRPRDGLNS